jgi:hypothetical protein
MRFAYRLIKQEKKEARGEGISQPQHPPTKVLQNTKNTHTHTHTCTHAHTTPNTNFDFLGCVWLQGWDGMVPFLGVFGLGMSELGWFRDSLERNIPLRSGTKPSSKIGRTSSSNLDEAHDISSPLHPLALVCASRQLRERQRFSKTPRPLLRCDRPPPPRTPSTPLPLATTLLPVCHSRR